MNISRSSQIDVDLSPIDVLNESVMSDLKENQSFHFDLSTQLNK